MKTRMPITLFLGLFVGLFLGVSFAVVRAYALPSPEWVRLGPVDDYPPGEAPYLYREENAGLIYIVNIHGEIIVLSARDQHVRGGKVNWVPVSKRFIDPTTGTHYWLDGTYDPAFATEPMDMARNPVKIEDGTLWIDLSGIGG